MNSDIKIQKLRLQIDEIDQNIIELLSRRIELAIKIGKLKKELNINILDLKRWEQVMANVINKCDNLQLDKEKIIEIYEIIHKYTIEIEKNS